MMARAEPIGGMCSKVQPGAEARGHLLTAKTDLTLALAIHRSSRSRAHASGWRKNFADQTVPARGGEICANWDTLGQDGADITPQVQACPT